MAHKKKNKPKFRDKEGNIHLQIFKNKGANGEYVTYKITSYRFPFGKYNQEMTLMKIEVERLMELLERKPEVVLKKQEKKEKFEEQKE